MSNQNERDDALFEALGQSKKKHRRRIIRTVAITLAAVLILGIVGIAYLSNRVRERFAAAAAEVLTYEASTGTISTVVSGSGTLANVDTEAVTVPAGVEITEVLVSRNDAVAAGDVLALVDMASVRGAMADLQTQIDELDEQISDAEDDRVSSQLRAGVPGRVKILYAEKGSDVVSTMVEQGALAVLSLDGFMALELETDALAMGDAVTVLREDGTELKGKVDSLRAGVATILVTDNGPRYGEEVTVRLEDGTGLGSAPLYIHNPLAVTGYAGTVNAVLVRENQKVTAYTQLFTLKDTGYSANYDALLRQRGEIEETLLELLNIQRGGAILSPMAGSVYSLTEATSGTAEYEIMTLSPDVSMSVTITVDESDILSLELGQEADVTVSSVSDEVLTGTVTEIDTNADSGYYTAVITLGKIDGMLPGMTADVDVRIKGVENAIIIPAEALHRTSATYYVYTSYDSETGEYGGMTEVEIGLMGSNFVEITAGLPEGTTVYYTETINLMDFFAGMMGGGNGGNGGGMNGRPGGDYGGEMPEMGDMPRPGGRG